jgi:hypothetical protein
MMNAECRMVKWGIIELNYNPRLLMSCFLALAFLLNLGIFYLPACRMQADLNSIF